MKIRIKTILVIFVAAMVLPGLAFSNVAREDEASITFLASGNLEGHLEGRKG